MRVVLASGPDRTAVSYRGRTRRQEEIGYFPSFEVPTLESLRASPESEARGLALLKEWLSPAQRAEYEKLKHFEVRGGDTGTRYRIRHGTQMNIEQLDNDGRRVCGWCFLPEGGLVAGDVMLAQKIALETNEKAALKVANKIAQMSDFVVLQPVMAFQGRMVFT